MTDRRSVLKAGVAAAAALEIRAQQPGITTSVMLWTLKGSFEERMETAAKGGVQSVELVAEHTRWSGVQIADARKLARSLKLGMDTVIATPDWGSRPVSLVRPEQRDNFLADIRQAIVFAQKLEVPQIILMSGNAVPGKTKEEQYASMLEGVKRSGDLAAKASLTLIIEPLNNKVDHKGFFLDNCVDGLRLVREAQNPHVKLLFDLYHEQVQAGNVIRTLTDAAPHVAVFHVADNPGRHDPGTGEMNYDNIYKAIAKTGFSGYLTMEYLPASDAATSLSTALKQVRHHL
jgi:hydroxypyruvate isomerase